MKPARIGFVGAGVIANRHAGVLLGFEDARVAAVADPQEERAWALASRCSAAAYTDVREMIEREALDAVYICVPPFAHGAPETAALEQRLPFFVEKPLAIDLETAETIARRVQEAGIPTAVGYHWRYLDTVERALELLSERPARLALGYWLDATPPPGWWIKEAGSGGQMVEQTTHIFDLARLLVGDVQSICATGSRLDRQAVPDADVFDVSVASLQFASGAIGSIASTCLLNWPLRIGLHLFSEGMAIELTEFEITIDIGRGRPIQHAEGDPFAREDRAFIDTVHGKPNRIRAPYSEALETHRLTMTAARSAREGRRLDVPHEAATGMSREGTGGA